jgi:hypothetical protein
MKRLPLLMDDNPSALARVGACLLVPIALVLLLPVLLLVVLALYLAAMFHGARVCVLLITGRRPTPEFELQKPHFLEMQIPAKPLPDKSQTPAP